MRFWAVRLGGCAVRACPRAIPCEPPPGGKKFSLTLLKTLAQYP